ncbi:MAG: hypothetical protein HDR28_01180 [Lachnospiraceae bacterium]|nr:hypothetical protein [Lachnospiraceae bacterium]
MVNTLYTLKKKYKDKKIYIWNINRDSMIVFTNAAVRKIDIQGFVSLQEEYIGEMYMNRPVMTLEQVEQLENSIILISDEVLKSKINLPLSDKIVYWSDALEFNEELRQKKIIIYGTGWGAKQLKRVLNDEGVKAELYCVTQKKDTIQQYQGVKVIEAAELEKYEEYALIISLVIGKYRQEILETLVSFQGQIYVEHIIGEVEMLHINLIQSIDLAIRKHKKIYLYSKKNVISELIEEVLSIYGIRIHGYVYGTEDEEQNIQNIYSLALEGIEDKLIIINEECPECLIRAREDIEFAGFSLEGGNYTGLQWYTRAKESLLLELEDCYDPLVGYSKLYLQEKPGTKLYGKSGWKIYGKEEEGRIRILVLGGSASAEVWHSENWISKLYHKLERKNIKSVIYNGAYECDDIVDEILRLVRDGNVLQPHIVISMSGVNNICFKESGNQFNERNLIDWIKKFSSDKEYCSGIYSDESLYSFWSRNVKLLERISEFYGAKFFGFLQPMNITITHMTLWEKSLYETEEQIAGAKNFAHSASDENGYINLMRLFEQKDEMYFDVCHYTDRAHEVIANKVYEVIMPVIERFMLGVS